MGPWTYGLIGHRFWGKPFAVILLYVHFNKPTLNGLMLYQYIRTFLISSGKLLLSAYSDKFRNRPLLMNMLFVMVQLKQVIYNISYTTMFSGCYGRKKHCKTMHKTEHREILFFFIQWGSCTFELKRVTTMCTGPLKSQYGAGDWHDIQFLNKGLLKLIISRRGNVVFLYYYKITGFITTQYR